MIKNTIIYYFLFILLHREIKQKKNNLSYLMLSQIFAINFEYTI